MSGGSERDSTAREMFRAQVSRLTEALALGPLTFKGTSKERLQVMGALWCSVRTDLGISRVQIANATGFDEAALELFENGQKDPKEISENFIEDLAFALGRPAMLAAHIVLFEQPDKSKKI